MASTYPGVIDSVADSGSLDLPNGDSLVKDLPGVLAGGAHSAIIAVETTLGVNPQGAVATVDARLTATESVANDALPNTTPLLQLGTTASTALKGDTTIPTVGTAAALDTGNASGEIPVLGAGGVFDLARLATGTPDGTKFVADDGTLKAPAGGGSGNVVASANFGTDNALIRSDGVTSGVQSSPVVVNDAGGISASSLTTKSNIEIAGVSGPGNGFIILGRKATNNFAAFQFKTAGTVVATVGIFNDASDDLLLKSDASDVGRRDAIRIAANGAITLNDEGGDRDTVAKGATDAHLMHVDASTDSVGVGTATPSEKLDVNGTVKANGYKSSDGSAGVTGSFTSRDSKTVTVKNGLITDARLTATESAIPRPVSLDARDYGAVLDGTADDTTALTAWLGALNAATVGSRGFLAAGRGVVSSALPALTADGITLAGVNAMAQAATGVGSGLIAGSTLTGTLLAVSGEGCVIDGLVLDAANNAATCLAVSGGHFVFEHSQTRANTSGGVGIDLQAGATSAWITDSVVNSVNGGVGVQVNDTDSIISGNKIQNAAYSIELLTGASGTQILNNHITPGSAHGVNGLWVNGAPNNLMVNANRFDNFVNAAIQLSPSGYPHNLQISSNQFQSTVQTDATFPLIGYDTTSGLYRGLCIVANNGYAASGSSPKYFLAAQKQDGTAAGNLGRVASSGTLSNSNSAWVTGTFYAASCDPAVSRGNIVSTNGTVYSAVTDI